MSLAKTVRAAVGAHSTEDVAQLGQSIERVTRTTERALWTLHNGPATRAELLGVVPVAIPIDFATLDRLAKEAARVLKADPGASFVMNGAEESLAAWVERLDAIMAQAEPFRRHVK